MGMLMGVNLQTTVRDSRPLFRLRLPPPLPPLLAPRRPAPRRHSAQPPDCTAPRTAPAAPRPPARAPAPFLSVFPPCTAFPPMPQDGMTSDGGPAEPPAAKKAAPPKAPVVPLTPEEEVCYPNPGTNPNPKPNPSPNPSRPRRR